MTVIEDRLTTVEVGLEDLQSGMEAGSRVATSVHDTAVTLDHMLEDRLKAADLTGVLVHRVADLRACLKEQRQVLRVLRQNLSMLREELQTLRRR